MDNFTLVFKTVLVSMLEIFILGACGFIMVRKKFLDEAGLRFLMRLVVEFILPLFIFTKTLKSFSFVLYPNWWTYTVIGLIINLVGFIVAYFWLGIFKTVTSESESRQFISLVSFQNSGYIPLILATTLLSAFDAEQMYIYIFLLLLGFNVVIWSFGVWFLSRHSIKNFEMGSMFSPPVIATILAMVLIGFGIDKIVPKFVFEPAEMLGNCLLPLAMIVTGSNLALVSLKNVKAKAIAHVSFLKLILLPILAFIVFFFFRPEYLFGVFVILQVAMPSANSLSLITWHYNQEDTIISHGIFFTHLFCILSIPLWLIVYEIFAFFK
ncbi:MAG TPA: AEC family transporter [Candidatus Omnitrophota bacterium]|nr:AEC family transporter [Candidatus Omnitrophota bacterium]